MSFSSFDTSDLATHPVFTWRPPASISRESRSPAHLLKAQRKTQHILVRHVRPRDAASQGRGSAAQRSIGVSPSAAAAPSLAKFLYFIICDQPGELVCSLWKCSPNVNLWDYNKAIYLSISCQVHNLSYTILKVVSNFWATLYIIASKEG